MRPNKLKEHTMSANADVRARIDEHIKEEATARLAMISSSHFGSHPVFGSAGGSGSKLFSMKSISASQLSKHR